MQRRVLYQDTPIERPYPKNLSEKAKPYFDRSKKGDAREVFVSEFSNVCVNNELFIKKRYGKQIMVESFGDVWQDGKYNVFLYQLKSFLKNLARSNKTVDKGLWCFDQFSTGGYFHWITEIAPRLWVAKREVDPNIPLVIPSYFLKKWSFAQAFIQPFQRQLIEFPEDEVIQFKQMTFMSQTGGLLNYQPEPIHGSTEFLLHHYYDKDYPTSANQKIYISRNKTGKRMLLNEAEILPFLKKQNFKILNAESLTVKDQVNIFSRASHVFSVHGAGLSNMVFMPPQSRVIEIRHDENNHMLNCFYTLAHTFEHHYYYILGQDKGDSLPIEHRPEDKSIHVNVQDLIDLLERF